jgi:hypothetical protein
MMNSRTVTGSAETDLEADAIMGILMNPQNIPTWAPSFADHIAAAGANTWNVTKGERTFLLDVVVEQRIGTVDYLRDMPAGGKSGAYIRVVDGPTGGSVVVMTLPIPPDSSYDRVATILDQELNALIRLARSRPGR